MSRLIFFRTSPLPTATADRSFKLPEDGWIQIAIPGEVRAPMEPADPEDDEVEVIQVFDQEAAETVLRVFNRQKARPGFSGLLVDFDHFSHDTTKESRAAAWIEELEIRNGSELWAKPRITHSGRAALEGGDYRHISPVFGYPDREYKPGERVRPAFLESAGLTNQPRIIGMRAISNRQTAATAERSETQPTKTMKKVMQALGLADDASEDSAVAAIATIKNRASSAETELGTLKTSHATLLGDQVERDLDDAGIEGEARAKWKTRLIANRADTLPLLADVKAARGEQTADDDKGETTGADKPAYRVTHNRGGTKQPGSAIEEEKKRKAGEQRAARISNRARELRSKDSSMSVIASYQAAEAELADQEAKGQ
jgi:phage I-like protein